LRELRWQWSQTGVGIVALLVPLQAGARPVSLPPAPDHGSLPMILYVCAVFAGIASQNLPRAAREPCKSGTCALSPRESTPEIHQGTKTGKMLANFQPAAVFT